MNPVHYFKTLAGITKSGEMEVQIGKYYLANNEWGEAIMAFKEGLKKGRLSNPEEAYNLLKDACGKAGVVIEHNELTLA